jgi:hypothetical protein
MCLRGSNVSVALLRTHKPMLRGSVPPVLTSLLYGMLGLEPDAARQRIRLSPWIPDDWTFFDVDDLRFGENRVTLRYHRNESAHTFALIPQAGTIPLRLIFEPSLEVQSITRVAVDGQNAVLDLRQHENRWICPMQVSLDHERTIVITTEEFGP